MNVPSPDITRSIGLDIGSTSIKAAALLEDGSLDGMQTTPAPPLRREGLTVEFEPDALFDAVDNVLDPFSMMFRPFGMACQRSSFLVWEKETGRPVTPVISWQDRRALDWCEAHLDHVDKIVERTGLPLSPHYFGPKLASLLLENPFWREEMKAGKLLAGTIDAWLIWKWTEGNTFVTDASMAGRTLLADLETGGWSKAQLELFGIPREALPDVVDSVRSPVVVKNGLFLSATVGDQGACLLGGGIRPGEFLVNMGTGVFVSRLVEGLERRKGFLTGPVYVTTEQKLYALEGTINGGARTLAGLSDGGGRLDPAKLTSDFCLPDESGVGAPHWVADKGLTFSRENLKPQEKQYLFREGLVYRIRENLEALGWEKGKQKIFLSGGLSSDPVLRQLTPLILEQPVILLQERETALLGAAGSIRPVRSLELPVPGPVPSLVEKYDAWKTWVQKTLGRTAS